MTLRLLDLFSGIGGISKGLEASGGIETVAFCEIEPDCRTILGHHWPGVPIYDDVKTLTAPRIIEEVGHVDILCGGFPCQDVSSAGKGKGIGKGTRSGLWREIFRIVRGMLRAGRGITWLLLENVPALRTRGYDRIKRALERIGYTVEPTVVGAWAVGFPHRRDRVWITCRLADAHCCRSREDIVSTELRATGFEQPSGDSRLRGTEGEVSEIPRRRNSELAHAEGRGQRADGGALGPTGHPYFGDSGMVDAIGGSSSSSSRVSLSVGRSQGRITVDGSSHRGTELANATRHGGNGSHREAGSGRGVPSTSNSLRPARPGERQNDWEAPRLTQFEVGAATDGLSSVMVRYVQGRTGWTPAQVEAWWIKNKIKADRAANKAALKMAGNSVVPQVVELFGRFIVFYESWKRGELA